MGFVSDNCSHVLSYSCITKNLSSVSTSGSIRYQPDEHVSLIELPSEQFSVGNHIKPSEQQLMSVDAWPREIVNVSRPIHSRPIKKKKKKKKKKGTICSSIIFDCKISLCSWNYFDYTGNSSEAFLFFFLFLFSGNFSIVRFLCT